MKKTLKDYALQLNSIKDSPRELASMYADLSSRYAYMSEEEKELDIKRAEFWDENKVGENGKAVSDMKLRMMWLLNEDGKKHNSLKIDQDACKELMKAINAIGITNHHLTKGDY